MEPRTVYQAILARAPQFAAIVAADIAAMSAPAVPPPAPTLKDDRVSHRAALKEASIRFLDELLLKTVPEGGKIVFNFPEGPDDVMQIKGYRFSRRHFARNYDGQFADDVRNLYQHNHNAEDVTASLSADGSALTLQVTYPSS